MQCILYKIYFWKVFHMYYKLICILYALLCGQNFILVKWVLQSNMTLNHGKMSQELTQERGQLDDISLRF
jgi:hypothetical protein